MYKIRILSFCFRALPNYYSLWLKSAERNSDIDFLVVTQDDIKKYNLPKNVEMIHAQFNDIIDQVKLRIGCEVNIHDPYKFCDMRAAFGYLFPEWFDGYDFWGGCDLDIIFGNLRKFITDDVLSAYDKILTHDHLYLYRNTREVNERFMLSVDGIEDFYRDVFSSDKLYCFNERAPHGMYHLYNQHGFSMWDVNIAADIFYGEKNFKICSEKEKKIQIFEWDNGNLLRYELKNKSVVVDEFCYIHLQKRPMKMKDMKVGDRFLIVPNRFVFEYKAVTPKLIKKYQSKSIVYWQNYKRKISKVIKTAFH